MPEISQRAEFNFLRYANVWEDADILLDALNIQPDGHYLSIASGGDNSLAMLSCAPASVLAIDLNPVQLYCTELKAVAIKQLDRDQCLQFLGFRHASKDWRLSTWHQLRPHLTPACKTHWQARQGQLAKGIIHTGKFERYFSTFRKFILPLIHSNQTRNKLSSLHDIEAQQAFYQQTWNNRRWRWLFALFFSQTVLGRLGRDPAFFKHVDVPVARSLFLRAEHALTRLPIRSNPYLQYILTGQFGDALPLYLRAGHFDKAKANIGKLQLKRCSLKALLEHYPAHFSGANLSNIFEYMDEDEYHQALSQLVSICQPSARLSYWNMLVPRRRPESMTSQIEPLRELSEALYERDKAFFYSDFVVEKVS